MLIAILDATHTVIRLEDVVDPEYDPMEPWVEALPDWKPGDTVVDGVWTPGPSIEPVPDRVTARQFKMQLLADNLLDTVEAWVASQPRAVQVAYDSSGTFVRDEPMMQAGFAALGFTTEQIDAFFRAAATL